MYNARTTTTATTGWFISFVCVALRIPAWISSWWAVACQVSQLGHFIIFSSSSSSFLCPSLLVIKNESIYGAKSWRGSRNGSSIRVWKNVYQNIILWVFSLGGLTVRSLIFVSLYLLKNHKLFGFTHRLRTQNDSNLLPSYLTTAQKICILELLIGEDNEQHRLWQVWNSKVNKTNATTGSILNVPMITVA